MIDRLNARNCFDALYRQAEFRLRDIESLRNVMSNAWRLSLSPDSKKLQREQERDVALREDAELRVIPWQMTLRSANGSDKAKSLGVDWSHVPTINTGSRFGGASLINAVMKDYPTRLKSSSGEDLHVAELSQRNRYLPLLLGGVCHPAFEVSEALEEVRKRHKWDGPIVFVPTQLFTGLIRIKVERDEMANAECAALPPLESVMCLRGSAIEACEDFREMLVVWFSTEYGIEPSVIEFIHKLDWKVHSVPCSY